MTGNDTAPAKITKEIFDQVFKEISDNYGNTATKNQKMVFTKNRIKNTYGVDINIKDFADFSDNDFIQENARLLQERAAKYPVRQINEGRAIKKRENWDTNAATLLAEFKKIAGKKTDFDDMPINELREKSIWITSEVDRAEARVAELKRDMAIINVAIGRKEALPGWVLGQDILDFINGNPDWTIKPVKGKELVKLSMKSDGDIHEISLFVMNPEGGTYQIGFSVESDINIDDDDANDRLYEAAEQIFGDIDREPGEEVIGEYDDKDDDDGNDGYDDEKYWEENACVIANEIEEVKEIVLKALLVIEKEFKEFSFFD